MLQSYRKFCSVPVDPSLYSAIKIGKKMPRVKSPNPDQPLLLRDKEVLRVHRTLPAYMHNQGTRLGAAHAHQVTYRDLNIAKTEYLDPKSTLQVGLSVRQKISKYKAPLISQ